ncbi:MAG: PA14 domain-containing protein [Victivallaceae bacterium]|nr:PA14 domain-containing protein [Victivallaceae bacterium]
MKNIYHEKITHDIFIIGFIILLTTPIGAQDRYSDAKKSKSNETVNQNTNLQGSDKRDRDATPPIEVATKAKIITDSRASKPTIKPAAMPKLNNPKLKLPSVVNAYNYLYSHQNWNTASKTTTPSPFGTTNFDEFALKGNLYYLQPNTDRLPDFSAMTAIGTIYIPKLDIPKRAFTTGFPGVDKRFEWFGIRYIGAFKLQQGGQYKFRLASDDGSKLWINNKLIINNDGVHSPSSKSGTVDLSAGQHLIQVDYFQGPRVWIALQLYVTEPNGREQIFSPELISNKTIKAEVTDSDKTKHSTKFTLKFVRPNQTQPQISTK